MDKSGDLSEDAPNWNTHPAAASQDPPTYRESNLSLSHTTRRGARTLARAVSNAECSGGENSRENECHPTAPPREGTWCRGAEKHGAARAVLAPAQPAAGARRAGARAPRGGPPGRRGPQLPALPALRLVQLQVWGAGGEGGRAVLSVSHPSIRNGSRAQGRPPHGFPIPVQMRPVYTPRQRSYFLYGRCRLDSAFGIIICNGILLLKEC